MLWLNEHHPTSDTSVVFFRFRFFYFWFRILYLMLQNDFLLWQMYFLSLESVPQLLGAIPQFLGELPQFWGELPQTQRGGIKNVPSEQRNSITRPKSLNLLPKTKCVITAIRQPKEVSLMCYSSTW